MLECMSDSWMVCPIRYWMIGWDVGQDVGCLDGIVVFHCYVGWVYSMSASMLDVRTICCMVSRRVL